MAKDEIMGEPYIAIGYNELTEPIGDTVKCPNCGVEHKVKNEGCMSYVKCPENNELYLVGVEGKKIPYPRGEK